MTNIGNFRDIEEVKLSAKDFSGGNYNVLKHAYSREGMELATDGASISKVEFNEEHVAYADINYKVAYGWRAVRKGPSIVMPRSIYIGKLKDVEFVQANQLLVNIYFQYQNGTLAGNMEQKMITQNDYTK